MELKNSGFIKEMDNEAKAYEKCKHSVLSIGLACRRIPTKQFDDLKRVYMLITDRLNQEHNRKAGERHQTLSERSVIAKIERSCKLTVHSQVWIGTRCVDIFIPSVAGKFPKRAKGLIIEIDGSVHDRAAKMKKDQSKENLLRSLGIMCTCLLNENLADKSTQKLLEEIGSMPRLTSREKKRLWKKIYFATILLSGTSEERNQFIPSSEVKND